MYYDSVSYCAVHDGGSPTPISVRAARESDLRRIVRIHMDRLPHGFFVRLGPRYLRAYDRTFMGHDSAVALVAAVDGVVVGFLVGATDVHAHRRWVLSEHGRRLALVGAAAMLVRPTVAFEFLRTRLARYARALTRRPTPAAPSATSTEPSATAVLTHVAVDSAAAGRGAGTALVGAFVDAVRRSGGAHIELVTLTGEAGAADFYRRLGWRESGTSSAGGSSFHRFVLDVR